MLARHLTNLQVVAEDGIAYNLYSGANPADLLHLDGAGMAEVRRINQRLPLQNGVVDKGFRLEPRKMTLGLFVSKQTELDADLMRDKLAYIFGPTITALQLKATRLDGTVRAIDCFVDGAVYFPQSDRLGASQKIIVPLYAPDPTFYDPTRQSQTANLSTGTGAITIPSAGLTADDWPVFEVTGPITSLRILHFPVGDELQITGTIPSGETWEFDLRPSYKTVKRMSDGANRLNFLVTGTVRYMSTLRILGEKLTRSYIQTANSFTVTGTSTTGASQIVLRYYKRYLSL